MKTKAILLSLTASAVLFSCSNGEEQTTETSTEETAVEEVAMEPVEETVQEVVEKPVELSVEDKIQGKWQQTHQRCDENGENGEEMSKETYWEFDGTNVTWSSFTHPYRVENDQILIGEGEGSPYEITKEDGDIIVLKAVKTNRFMRLVKAAE